MAKQQQGHARHYEKMDAALLRVWQDRDDPERLKRHVALWGIMLSKPPVLIVRLEVEGEGPLDLDPAWGVSVSEDRRRAAVPLPAVMPMLELDRVKLMTLSVRHRHPRPTGTWAPRRTIRRPCRACKDK